MPRAARPAATRCWCAPKARNIAMAAPLMHRPAFPERPRCRSNHLRSRPLRRAIRPSRRRKSRPETHSRKCRRRCRSPASRRGQKNCRAARLRNCRCEDRKVRARPHLRHRPEFDLRARKPDPNPGISDMSQGTMWNYGLKRSPECAMNKHLSGPCAFINKYRPAFEGRHNPA
jgi:hypothetical protein